jgi:hypothetical protein
MEQDDFGATSVRRSRIKTHNSSRKLTHDATEHATATQPSDGPSDDERSRARRGTTDRGANLKAQHIQDEERLGLVELVHLAHQQLEAARREQVRRAIPADVCYRVEFVRDGWDRRRDDVLVLKVVHMSAHWARAVQAMPG